MGGRGGPMGGGGRGGPMGGGGPGAPMGAGPGAPMGGPGGPGGPMGGRGGGPGGPGGRGGGRGGRGGRGRDPKARDPNRPWTEDPPHYVFPGEITIMEPIVVNCSTGTTCTGSDSGNWESLF
jgi:hypothetical protein